MSKASDTVVFEYNASGLRIKKTATSTGTIMNCLHDHTAVRIHQRQIGLGGVRCWASIPTYAANCDFTNRSYLVEFELLGKDC